MSLCRHYKPQAVYLTRILHITLFNKVRIFLHHHVDSITWSVKICRMFWLYSYYFVARPIRDMCWLMLSIPSLSSVYIIQLMELGEKGIFPKTWNMCKWIKYLHFRFMELQDGNELSDDRIEMQITKVVKQQPNQNKAMLSKIYITN